MKTLLLTQSKNRLSLNWIYDMPQVKVLRTFVNKGQTITEGTLLTVSDQIVDLLGDCVEVMSLSPAELLMQQQSSDWRWVCDSHERTLPESYCQLKRDNPRDPFDCIGWQIKNQRKTLQ